MKILVVLFLTTILAQPQPAHAGIDWLLVSGATAVVSVLNLANVGIFRAYEPGRSNDSDISDDDEEIGTIYESLHGATDRHALRLTYVNGLSFLVSVLVMAFHL